MNTTVHDQKMPSIDLRSDTVTWPTLEMRVAMANSPVGDDVFGDEPTVKKLEEDAAIMLGKEAALFVSSGTLGNLLAILGHCQLGDEAIMGDISHVFLAEAGGIAAVAGVLAHTVPVQADGSLRLEDIKNAVRIKDDHHPNTRMIIIENTQNEAGGLVLPVSYIDAVGKFAASKGLILHIDGARIFNAAAALNVDVKVLVAAAQSITFCLSKGLCAPFGSVLCGSRDFIEKCRHKRKMLGGGLRQSGIMASAGLIAIHKMSKRLHEDHANARRLYEGIKDLPGLKSITCNTNFVWFRYNHPTVPHDKFSEQLLQFNIKLNLYAPPDKFRCAIHYWITTECVDKIIQAFKLILKPNPGKL
jgi:threonine aldolase